jgi:YihY family inner membrane protein
VRIRRRQLVHKFFADRGTHLAAMVAYFALLSFVPLVFLALSLFGLAHRARASDFFVRELTHDLPGTSHDSIIRLVRRVQDNAAALGIIGGVFLLWSSLSLFSVLESAFNLVYDQHNRPFLQGKALAVIFMLASLVTLFAGLLIGSLGAHVLNRFASGFLGRLALAGLPSPHKTSPQMKILLRPCSDASRIPAFGNRSP